MPDGKKGSAQVTIQEYAKNHQKAFRAAFDFLNTHFPPGPDLAWWDSVAKECSEISAKMNNDRLVIYLLAGIMYYLEDLYKERKKENGEA